MTALQFVLGWIGIGFAAALAAMIMPFRRGVVGVATNAVVSIAGAVSLALLGVALGMSKSVSDPVGFAFAGLGSVAFLIVLHVLWERSTHVARHADR